MSYLIEHAQTLGIGGLTPLSLYGTLSIIVLGALIVGLIAQAWKGRSGGVWALFCLVLASVAWFAARTNLDPTWYIAPWGGEQGWGSLALGVTAAIVAAQLVIVALLPARRSGPAPGQTDHRPRSSEPAPSLSSEPMTPILPRPPAHSFRRKLFAPMVVLGVAALIVAGVLSVEKRQLDIFLRQLGLIKAEAPAAPKPPTATIKKAAPAAKPVIADPLILRAQELLLALDYKAGAPDGVLGGETSDAVLAYQKWEGLPRDGKITSELVQHLEKVLGTRSARGKEVPIAPDFQAHANMCVRGVQAWYRSRTTKLSIDGITQSSDKWEFVARVWFSYPGESMERVRANAVCKYSRYRDEMPEAPFTVIIRSDGATETLTDREVACFSQGQPC